MKKLVFILLFLISISANVKMIKAANSQSELNGEWEKTVVFNEEIQSVEDIWFNDVGLESETDIYKEAIKQSQEKIWNECEENSFSIIDINQDGKLEMIRKAKYKNKDGVKIAVYYYEALTKYVKRIAVLENNTINTAIFYNSNGDLILCTTYYLYLEYKFYSVHDNIVLEEYSISIEISDDLVKYHRIKDGTDTLLLELPYEKWEDEEWNNEMIEYYIGNLREVEFLRIEEELSVCIEINGEEYGIYPLGVDQEIQIGETNICKIESGTCRMITADCPEQICISQGIIQKEGEMIICLPNKVLIEIISDNGTVNGGEIDATS